MQAPNISATRQTRNFHVLKYWVVLGCYFIGAMSWALPDDGPAAQTGKNILFIASDLRNGGVKSVSDAFVKAAKSLKWKVTVINSASNKAVVIQELREMTENTPDGIVLAGFDGADFSGTLKKMRKKGAKIVGWHAASKSGVTPDLFTNITTDAMKVAEVAAKQIKNYGPKKGGVLILTTRDYAIATTKTLEMKKAVEAMEDFKLLAVEDIAFSRIEKEMPHLVKSWNQRYGKTWTHTLAINDLYFDSMGPTLRELHREDIVGIGAGDGSDEAILRVNSIRSTQMVTVAEPLKTQGWQVADELNRAFAGEPPSDYMTEPLVITKQYIESLKKGDIEENIPYESTYLKIWYPSKKMTEL